MKIDDVFCFILKNQNYTIFYWKWKNSFKFSFSSNSLRENISLALVKVSLSQKEFLHLLIGTRRGPIRDTDGWLETILMDLAGRTEVLLYTLTLKKYKGFYWLTENWLWIFEIRTFIVFLTLSKLSLLKISAISWELQSYV